MRLKNIGMASEKLYRNTLKFLFIALVALSISFSIPNSCLLRDDHTRPPTTQLSPSGIRRNRLILPNKHKRFFFVSILRDQFFIIIPKFFASSLTFRFPLVLYVYISILVYTTTNKAKSVSFFLLKQLIFGPRYA